MLQVNDLHKAYGQTTIIQQASFSVPQGSITAFVGANGAGKTTVMKSLLGFTPFTGSIEVDGEPVVFGTTHPAIGYLPDVPAFYHFYTAPQYLAFCQQLRGVKDSARIATLLQRVGLADATQKIGHYSRGMRQRLGMAQALLHRPKLVICDEPTSALDPQGREAILHILKSSQHETTVLFSTHILAEAEAISDRLLVLHNKGIAYEGALPTIASATTYTLTFATIVKLDTRFSAFMPQQVNGQWQVTVPDEAARAKLLQTLLLAGYIPTAMQPVARSLQHFLTEVTSC